MGDHYAGARGYCDHFTHKGYGSPKAECPACTPDLRQPISEPPAIRADAMADSRRLRWTRLDAGAVVRLDLIYIGASYNEQERLWQLGRVRYCEDCGQWEMATDKSLHERSHEAANIQYLAEDVLGTP